MVLDLRKRLLVLHAISFVIAIGGSMYGWFMVPTDLTEDLLWQYPIMKSEKPILMAYMSISALWSATLLIVGALSPSLHQDSSGVVHSSLMLSFLHLAGYSLSISFVSEKSFTGAVVSASLHMVLLLLCCVQGIAVLCSFSAHRLTTRIEGNAIYLMYMLLAGALHNIFTTCEGIMSLYWGVPHQKTMGINGLISGVLLGLSVLFAAIYAPAGPQTETTSLSLKEFHLLTLPWVPVAALLAVVHSLLCVVVPTFISTVPAIFLRVHQTEGPEVREDEGFGTRRRASGSSDAGVGSPSSQYGRLYSIGSFNHVNDATAESTGRLAVAQLFMTGSFTRNFLFCVS